MKTVVSAVRVAPGELGFRLQLPDRAFEIWLTTDFAITPSADAVVPLSLIAAMTQGGRLAIPDPIDPRLRASLDEVQDFYVETRDAWDWPAGKPTRVSVESRSRSGPDDATEVGAGGAIGAFFSGGVDSFFTVLEQPDITHVVHITGFDLPLDVPEREWAVVSRLRSAASEMGKTFIHVRTNLRELLWARTDWGATYGAGLATVALALSPAFSRIYIPGGPPDQSGVADGTSARLDHLWSTTRMATIRSGGRDDRITKLKRVADSEVARRSLRVCLDEDTSQYGCGRCRKCLRAMVLLEAFGVRDRFAAFPPILDLGAAFACEPAAAVPSVYTPEHWERWIRKHPDPDLVDAMEWLFCGTPTA